MVIPVAINNAATQYTSRHGGSIEIYNAFIEGWQQAQKEKKANIKEATLAMDDEYTFERWWKLYDKKTGKDKCMEKWFRLTFDERKKATEHTPVYVASTPDKKFRKDPQTYLNQHCWNDEIIWNVPAHLIEADADKFMAYFNKLFAGTRIPMLTEMTCRRKGALNYIYTYYQKDILGVLNKVLDSSHLTGEDGKGFLATFEFIFNPDNFLKIKEGYFDD